MSIIAENIEANRFVIMNIQQTEDNEFYFQYWNNEDGWVDLASATFFDQEEVTLRHLPFFGAWLPVSRAELMTQLLASR
jgi:hypothetical protein